MMVVGLILARNKMTELSTSSIKRPAHVALSFAAITISQASFMTMILISSPGLMIQNLNVLGCAPCQSWGTAWLAVRLWGPVVCLAPQGQAGGGCNARDAAILSILMSQLHHGRPHMTVRSAGLQARCGIQQLPDARNH